jgi:hypothetical protein
MSVTQEYLVGGVVVAIDVPLKSVTYYNISRPIINTDHVKNSVPKSIYSIKQRDLELIVFEYQMHPLDGNLSSESSPETIEGSVFTLQRSEKSSWAEANLQDFEYLAPPGSSNYDTMQRLLSYNRVG